MAYQTALQRNVGDTVGTQQPINTLVNITQRTTTTSNGSVVPAARGGQEQAPVQQVNFVIFIPKQTQPWCVILSFQTYLIN